MLHILLDKLDVRPAIDANPVFLQTHLALLIYHELFGVSAVEANELETTLALVNTIELAE